MPAVPIPPLCPISTRTLVRPIGLLATIGRLAAMLRAVLVSAFA